MSPIPTTTGQTTEGIGLDVDSSETGVETIAGLGAAVSEPRILEKGKTSVVVVPPGSRAVAYDLDREVDEARPRRLKGSVTVSDDVAFCAYVNRYVTDDTEVWARVNVREVTAVLNAGGGDNGADGYMLPGWGDHRVTLDLEHTEAWLAFDAIDKKYLTQTAFAEFVEQWLPRFVLPSGADMLELAQHFKATSRGSFESGERLKSGATTIEYRETIEAKAGQKGQLEIPDVVEVALKPFEVDGDPFKVTCRFRYRIVDANLHLGFVMDRPEDVVKAAFNDILERIRANITPPIWNGTPLQR